MDTRQVRIELVTRDETLKAPIPSLLVPVTLKRYGLSEIVNQVLENEKILEKPVPFDFLISNQLLRSSLNEYLTSQGLSSEITITVEYTKSILPPSFLASFSQDDWVSAVHISRHSTQPNIVTGSYDGVVRVWNQSGKVTNSLVGHHGAIKAARWIDLHRLVSTSADRNLIVWNLTGEDEEDGDKKKSKIVALLQGHTGSVDDICLNRKTNHIVSASADCTLKLWSTNYNDLPLYDRQESTNSTSSKKRRRIAEAMLPPSRTRACLSTLSGHSSPVTGVEFHPSDNHVVYSVAQDHTIRTWDLATSRLIDTRATSFPLLSITTLPAKGLLVCGSSARHLTLHDPRSTTTTTQAQLIGHSNFVVSLASSPTSEYMLVSGSHDGTARIWDIRTNKPVYVITRQSEEKPTAVYGVDWDTQIGIASVGQDKKLQINSAV